MTAENETIITSKMAKAPAERRMYCRLVAAGTGADDML
jgi:hypothetical protein